MPEKVNVIETDNTLIGKAVNLDRYCSNFFFKLLFLVIWTLGLFSIAAIISGALLVDANQIFAERVGFGYIYVFAGVFLFYLPIRDFYLVKVHYPKSLSLAQAKSMLEEGKAINLYTIFSFELAKSTKGIFGLGQASKTGSDLTGAIMESKDMGFILVRLGINKPGILSALKDYKSKTPASEIIANSLEVALLEGHHQIEVGDVFVALCQSDPAIKELINKLKLDVSDVANIVYWQTNLVRKFLNGKRFLDPSRFKFSGGIGRDWAYGFTPLLNQFGLDLTKQIQTRGLGLEIVGREREIEQIEEAMLRSGGGGVVLVGEAGIGKRTTVLGFARKIALGQTKGNLSFKHLFELNLDAILSGATGGGDVLERLNALFSEVLMAGNAVVFIENIENLLASRGAGSVNAGEVLISFLDRTDLCIIGSISVAGYNEYISPNTALSARFARVTVEESNEAETIRILEDTVPVIEGKTGSVVSYEALKETVKLANKYIVDSPNPEKSINVLDGAVARATNERHETVILPEDIMNYVSEKYEVPSSQVGETERQKLLSLEDEMRQSVVGQDEAIRAIAGAMKRARAGVVDSRKPIGSFLFLGPTGVGKTETAKALAKAYFGSSDKMIRFDMSEYQNEADIYRLIGSNLTGQNLQGSLTTAVREHPFSLLLFDEVEKANKNILDLFLQILDEGHLTDGSGRKVLFTNSIIICTSNAGANLIRESIQNKSNYEAIAKKLLDYLQKEDIYRPEFLNRFTQIVAFSPLSKEEISKIARLMIERVKKTLLATKRVKIDVDPEAIKHLAEIGFDPEMGARPMARVIEEKVENLLADKILANELKEGDSYTIRMSDIS